MPRRGLFFPVKLLYFLSIIAHLIKGSSITPAALLFLSGNKKVKVHARYDCTPLSRVSKGHYSRASLNNLRYTFIEFEKTGVNFCKHRCSTEGAWSLLCESLVSYSCVRRCVSFSEFRTKFFGRFFFNFYTWEIPSCAASTRELWNSLSKFSFRSMDIYFTQWERFFLRQFIEGRGCVKYGFEKVWLRAFVRSFAVVIWNVHLLCW